MFSPDNNFLDNFVDYLSSMEPPAIFVRWSAIAGLGAMLGRNYYFQHGHFKIYPNTYCMLMGTSGTRKSTPIKIMKSFLKEAGYDTIAADRSTKEKFLLDLAGVTTSESGKKISKNLDDFLGATVGVEDESPREMFIMADEFNDFLGIGNMEFLSLLGTLWDYEGAYENKIKNGQSVIIPNPTVSIIGGNTPTGFALAFPTEAMGQGFFSRLLLIHGEPSGKRITFPKPPDPEQTMLLLKQLLEIRAHVQGQAFLEPEAEKLLDKIYQADPRVNDVRFDSYSTRRFTHLIKLCLITSAARMSVSISYDDVIFANTILTAAEFLMPKALGEFGKARNSDISHRVLQIIESGMGVTVQDIWKQVHNDLEDMKALGVILQNLREADKIQHIKEAGGFLPKKKAMKLDSSTFNFHLLTAEEQGATT